MLLFKVIVFYHSCIYMNSPLSSHNNIVLCHFRFPLPHGTRVFFDFCIVMCTFPTKFVRTVAHSFCLADYDVDTTPGGPRRTFEHLHLVNLLNRKYIMVSDQRSHHLLYFPACASSGAYVTLYNLYPHLL